MPGRTTTPDHLNLDRLPASAGAGRGSSGDVVVFDVVLPAFGNPLEDKQKTFSLTYSEIGVRLQDCVDIGLITNEQAVEIGNILFPPFPYY